MGFVDPSPALLLLVALPLTWTLASLVASESTIARIAMAASGGLVVLAAALAGRLALAPAGHALSQHLALVARAGQIDLSLDLWLDPIAAVLAVVVAIVACGATLHTAWSKREGARERFGYGGLLTFGAMLTVIAEGWAPFVVGMQVATIATFAIAKELHERPARAALAADASIVVAAALIFSGAMTFEGESAPRFAAVSVAEDEGAKAHLSMNTYVGARVVADDGAPLPGEPLRSPFRVELDPGTYTFRVQPGVATPDVVVPGVTLAKGREHVIVPTGPTTSFRVLAAREASAEGRAPLAVMIFAFGALLSKLAATTARRASRSPGSVLAVIPIAVLALRISPLLDAGASRAAAVAAGVTALLLAGYAASSRDAPSALIGALSSSIALSIAASAVGERAGALVVACVAPLTFAGALSSLESRGDVRWLGAACAGASSLLPLTGASFGSALALAAMLGRGTAHVATACVLALAVALTALACFRVYDAAIRTRLEQGTIAQGRVATTLTVSGLLAGTVLGAGTSSFGGSFPSIAQRAASSAAGTAPRLSFAALGVSLTASLLGVVLARRLAESARVLGGLGAPSLASARLASRTGDFAALLARGVHVMDRDVIDDMAAFAGETLTKLGRLLRRAEARAFGGGDRSRVDALFVELGLRLGLDHPQRRERFRIAIVSAMVAFLGLLVLSSLLFR